MFRDLYLCISVFSTKVLVIFLDLVRTLVGTRLGYNSSQPKKPNVCKSHKTTYVWRTTTEKR